MACHRDSLARPSSSACVNVVPGVVCLHPVSAYYWRFWWYCARETENGSLAIGPALMAFPPALYRIPFGTICLSTSAFARCLGRKGKQERYLKEGRKRGCAQCTLLCQMQHTSLPHTALCITHTCSGSVCVCSCVHCVAG